METMLFKAWQTLWKTAAVIAAIVIGAFAASQFGWSAADIVVNPMMGFFSRTFTGLYFLAGAVIASGAWYLIERWAKRVLWIAGPIFLYCICVLGAWNGYVSDFDRVRG